jgi:hypothetical protein
MSTGGRKRYIMQVSPGGADFGTFEEFENREGQEFVKELLDEKTREIMECRIVISSTPQEDFDELILEGIGLQRSKKQWYVKILERLDEGEEEEITVFQSAKPSERRGYMLRSMAEEQKVDRKKEIMTSELEERKKRKQKLTDEILKKKS